MSLLENLKITKAIFHVINPYDDQKKSNSVKYIDEVIRLNKKIKETLRERIVNVLGEDSQAGIEMEVDTNENHDALERCIQSAVEKNSNSFKSVSKEICEILASAQNNKITLTGPVLFIQGTTTNSDLPCFVVIKADYQEGFRQIKKKLTHLDDIFLSPHQKLYKVALMIKKNQKKTKVESVKNYQYFMFDSQRKNQATKYFSKAFLGLKISENDKNFVSNFFEGIKDYINEKNIDLSKKTELMNHLYSYLKAPGNTKISTKEFADNYIEDGEKDDFKKKLKGKVPGKKFSKDTTLIDRSLKRRALEFGNSNRLTFPSEMNNIVDIKSDKQNKKTIIEISDTVKKQS